MSSSTLRADLSKLPTTLKEAVVDALLNMTYAQVSGDGPSGQYIFGARPRTVLNSGFLLPRKTLDGDDEVTSPIWISSHGLQLQIGAGIEGTIRVLPRCSVYVRVLPRREDLRRPDCQPKFLLRPEIIAVLQTERNQRLDSEWEKVKGAYTSRQRHPEWPSIQKQIINEVYAAHGIPTGVIAPVVREEPADGPVDGEEMDAQGIVAGADGAPAIKDEHFEPLAVPHKWLRLDIDLPAMDVAATSAHEDLRRIVAEHSALMNRSIAERLRSWSESEEPENGGKLWGYRHGLSIPASKYTDWQAFLQAVRESRLALTLPNIELGWDFQITPDWLDQRRRNVFISLENTSRIPKQHQNETDEALFLVSLRVSVPTAVHRPLRLERVEPSYRYNRYLNYPAIGHNGGVQVTTSPPEVRVLETTWAPRYIQPRIIPAVADNVQCRIRELSKPESLDGLSPLVPAMKKWLEALPSEVDPAAGLDSSDTEAIAREREAFRNDEAKWAAEMDAVASGLALLATSKSAWVARGPQKSAKGIVYEAWLAMNEAMADFMKARFGTDDNDWRLFQLAFIVANIPALASRIQEFKDVYSEKRDDAVTLLYFATGGGKSEAFFGLLLFNLLLDRLRGKQLGVTALIRYPLRLLTIQQAQRCSRVLAQGELVRRRHGYGGQPFSIGFWVGSGGSPNRHNAKGVDHVPEASKAAPTAEEECRLLANDPRYSAAVRAWRKLPKCPFCGQATALRRFAEHGDQVLGHVCVDLKCASNEGGYRPLPFYIVDEDIYDLAPSVLLGTVDKLALIGHSSRTIRRIFGMFGSAPWYKPRTGRLYVPDFKDIKQLPAAKGMEGVFPSYKNGKKLFHDPFPSLIIQDEAHLLDESLGTFAALFESTLDAAFARLGAALGDVVVRDAKGRPRRPKVIAASATVSHPERQLEHLYQRSIPASQFPHPGPALYESFYSKPQEAAEAERRQISDVEISSKQARIYTAFMTNGKPHTATSIAVLSGFHLTVTRLFDALTSGQQAAVTAAKSDLTLHVSAGLLQDLHRKALLDATPSELATIVDLHRIALTYVTNKKGGDQIMAAEGEETRKRHLNAGIDLPSLETRLITGSVDQGEIQAVVDTAQQRVKPGEPFPSLRTQLRSVIATSAISHGVDVDEFNSMFFAGMPPDIAEYIQASSRVGRTHVGFVVLIPTPQRRRDRHIVHIFDVFHRFLERMVQPAAIDRWAEKAVERVFPSLFQTYLLGVVPGQRTLQFIEDQKEPIHDYSFIPNVRRELEQRGDAFLGEIAGFVEAAVGLRDGFAPEGHEHYRRKISERIRNLIRDKWSTPLWGSGGIGAFFQAQGDPMLKPMTSLRDVDQAGVIFLSSRDPQGHRQPPEDVIRIMDLVRNGVAENDGPED